MSRHFELLNYSEHGTIVDNVVYCCDVSDDPVKSEIAEEGKEKRQSFSALDDLFRRSGDKTSGVPFESKEVIIALLDHNGGP